MTQNNAEIAKARKIVVVDDHQLFIDGMKLVISSVAPHIDILSETDVSSALDTIQKDPDIDLIMLDISMPDMDGLAFLTALRNRQTLIPAVVVSATENPQKIKDALELGAFGFIPKSHHSEELVSAINTVLGGTIYLPDKLAKRLARMESPKGRPGRKSGAHENPFGISKRQLDVLKLVAKGYSNKQIAMALFISEHTIKSHITKLFQLLEVDNRTACVRVAQERDIL